ncbi:riboflavin synthase subunit alpha [Peptococcaceae bacterium SCADC1_2_3]|nr:riboflavin synthase subunit alpha [Peptococcaceae bacterium SCADC1_2_3]KFI35398.1 riboflavin synthase subunit alpha [Peptococcaceae bacterium SCADC1_2_3]KFI36827.1 riboflavin synthase subunit alpha [Peptococcaceae bacterium SCADC1_2_3]HBQ28096.1 riboflavin synthase [Desulfotomaculum sp.]HCJ78720.1 riboflavin synthase [Desulfotomaculum sp.]
MFTGLIEELGVIQQISRGENYARLVIKANKVTEDIQIGDSIAVNGVCLTVVNLKPFLLTAEVMAETLAKSNLSQLKSGHQVNLERPLRLTDRLGGHLVSGHVDDVGIIIDKKKNGIAVLITIRTSPQVMHYIVSKGSVAIDGTSLTVASVREDNFQVSLIPHTRQATNLGNKKPGEMVNLEVDIIGKYIEKFLTVSKKEEGISLDFLAAHGYT